MYVKEGDIVRLENGDKKLVHATRMHYELAAFGGGIRAVKMALVADPAEGQQWLPVNTLTPAIPV